MSLFRSALLSAVLLLLAATASATPVVDQPLSLVSAPLSLRDALKLIWQESPEVQSAKAELEAARARARAADQPIYNPTLLLDAENADVDRRTAGVSLALDLSGKRRARSGQGSAEWRASEADYELRRRDVSVRWLRAWSMQALAAKQRELGQRRVSLMQRFDALAAQRLKVGDIGSTERDLAGLALGEAQLQQASLIGNEAAARALLAAIGGEQQRALPSLPSGLLPAADAITAVPADELPEMVQARARQDSAEAGVEVARRARVPDPTVSLTGGRVRSGPMSDRVIGIGVSIPLPVFNNGRAEIDAARADAEAAFANVRSRQRMQQAGLAETRARYASLQVAAAAFRSGRAGAFEERTALLEKLWSAGEIGSSDYLVQLKQSLDTALSGLALQSQLWQAWFDYLNASGRLVDWIDGNALEASR